MIVVLLGRRPPKEPKYALLKDFTVDHSRHAAVVCGTFLSQGALSIPLNPNEKLSVS